MARSDWLLQLRISFVSIDILKQWIASRARSDWLLQLRISFAIHPRATHLGFASETVVIVSGISALKSSFCAVTSLF